MLHLDLWQPEFYHSVHKYLQMILFRRSSQTDQVQTSAKMIHRKSVKLAWLEQREFQQYELNPYNGRSIEDGAHLNCSEP